MTTDLTQADVAVIGGGIVGLATGYQLARLYPAKQIVLLEKEAGLAEHQTGRNSGVIHSGIYYKPGSLKAINCREGRKALIEFCQQENIAHEICGKVIVAVDESELPALERIFQRGQANGVRCETIGVERLRELEPHAAGIRAIHVPEAGIVDYKGVCARLAHHIQQAGGTIRTGARVTGIRADGDCTRLESTAGEVSAKLVVNCTGLFADRVTALGGLAPPAKIVPFRGEYYELTPNAQPLCRNLIYPVPDPDFPFLGVHFTRMALGGVECGPNAVLAFAREGYHLSDVNLRDLAESLTYPGFLRLASRNWRMGLGELWRSISKRAFVKALQRLVPEIRVEHLHSAPAGVRAQALAPDGSLVDDFSIVENERIVNVLNAPSPAATASLNIGRLIVDRLAKHF
ncbi:MAG TPA: L-2-hydroxyglutarate oxidase [Planctomycetaceae bacterium]|nr:L-2-hydroxyglutarate oxidase [Planctomycetaceae bacterium]